MSDIPRFALYDESALQAAEMIQPSLALRTWSELLPSEKGTAWQQLRNLGWLDERDEVLGTIRYLNQKYLRACPGPKLHKIKPTTDSYGRGTNNRSELRAAALEDFQNIFVSKNNHELFYSMISKFAQLLIDDADYRQAEASAGDEQEKKVQSAFRKFDAFARALNHIFEQFAVNMVLTRNGLIPMQDDRIIHDVYVPTLSALAAPRWKTVNDDLNKMFEDYRNGQYAEVITKAHSALQRFLQILVGQVGKNAKGELGKLFALAKQEGLMPADRFTEPMLAVFQSFVSSERARNSTAKPALSATKSSDALLVMNTVLILLQHCLQSPNIR